MKCSEKLGLILPSATLHLVGWVEPVAGYVGFLRRRTNLEFVSSIAYCETHKDYVSRDLFNSILISEEEHIDWLETQIELVHKIGIENYLQSQT